MTATKKFSAVLTVGLVVGGLMAGGCSAISSTPLVLPDRHLLIREQLIVHTNFRLATQHRLIEELTARRFDVARALALPVSDEPVHIYLFENADRFEGFMRRYHPDFPRRRAFFVETDTRLAVYAHWGDRVAEDLRHEVTHGYLHSMAPHLPLWLDEGLAEYFEVSRSHGGLNRRHLDRLAQRLKKGAWQPDLRRLEQFDSTFAMQQDDYAEAWAWSHFLLHASPRHRRFLQEYMQRVRRDGVSEPLSETASRALGPLEGPLVDHIRRLAKST